MAVSLYPERSLLSLLSQLLIHGHLGPLGRLLKQVSQNLMAITRH